MKCQTLFESHDGFSVRNEFCDTIPGFLVSVQKLYFVILISVFAHGDTSCSLYYSLCFCTFFVFFGTLSYCLISRLFTPYFHADDGPWNWSETFVIKLWLSHLSISSWICLFDLSHKRICRKLWKAENE